LKHGGIFGIVTKRKGKHRHKRGYPVAVLIGFEENHAVLWRVFSKMVKPYITVELDRKRVDKKQLYLFHESVVDALRPMLKEGTRSIVVTAPMKTNYAREFLDHVQKHHAWLVRSGGPNAAVFGELVGSANQLHEVGDLVKTEEFHKAISKTTLGEANRILCLLEKHLNTVGDADVLCSIKEIEQLVYSQWKRGDPKPEYLLLTDRYLEGHKEKNRVHRLLQISKNKNIKTRVFKVETVVGSRLSQFGGIVLLTELERELKADREMNDKCT
jgi:stalled ribosome rescue protein Dom34